MNTSGKTPRRTNWAIVAAIAAVSAAALCRPGQSRASIIWGVQFVTPNGSPTGSAVELTSSQTAGLSPQDNWNPILLRNSSNTNLSYSDAPVNDNAGNNPITISFNAFTDNYNTGTYNGGATTNDILLSGAAKENGVGSTGTIILGGVPTGTYSLIAYTVDDNAGDTGAYTIGTATYYALNQEGSAWNGTFIPTTSTTLAGATTPTNYVEFTGLTPSAGQIAISFEYAAGSSDGVAINALQLIAAPEPRSLALLAVAGAGLLLIGRRRKPA